MLTECLGLELGYEITTRKTRNTSLGQGDVNLGIPTPPGIFTASFSSWGKFKGPYFNILGIVCLSPEYPLELFGSLGATFLTVKFDRLAQSANEIPINIERTFEDKKTVLKIAAGLQYEILDCLMIRGSLGLETTSQFTLYSQQTSAFPPPTIKLKNTFLYGLGLIYSF